MSPQRKEIGEELNIAANEFLRSINIRMDADYPERIRHYYPTTKSLGLLKSLLGFEKERAFFVIAPYGSGKSITATYLLHLLENRAESAHLLSTIKEKIRHIDPGFVKEVSKISKNKKSHGLFVALHGYYSSLPEAIRTSVLESIYRTRGPGRPPTLEVPCDTIENIAFFLNEVKRKHNVDRIVIVWDEFGRHIETLVSQGRAASLIDIQLLAEYVARSADIPITFGLLLHQGLFHYASNLPQSVQTEWRKIEGRFKTIQYVDDSKEIYRLISNVVTSQRETTLPTKVSIASKVRELKANGVFKDFANHELSEILCAAYPLEPVALYLLPRLSARVAQHERTLFNFIYNVDLSETVGPEQLYDYFATSMQSDTSVGGTYRRWLETQSALSKIGNDPGAAKVLKTACLLGLGTSGERAHVSKTLLLLATVGYGDETLRETVNDLIEKKLLLYRKHSDAVAIWHGTDFDLRGRLEEEKVRQRDRFNLLSFLRKETPPPVLRPIRHNDNYRIRRFLEGEYHDSATLQSYVDWDSILDNLPTKCDGKVLYVIPEASEKLGQLRDNLTNQLKHPRLVAVLPTEQLPIYSSALEVWTLLQMQTDKELVEADPLVQPELQQMLDDARSHLHKLINRLLSAEVGVNEWFHEGKVRKLNSKRDVELFISDIMDRVYYRTPKINNEMIVRHKPSPAVAAGRRKLLLGILERSGKPNLSIEGNFPDASLLRTVLLNTGLYIEREVGVWCYSSPKDIADNGLHEVWDKFRRLLTEPSDKPKKIDKFFEELMRPPYGTREGLFPILFAAALMAFPTSIALTREGEYIKDLLPSEIERLCREPSIYNLMVLRLKDSEITYLKELNRCLGAQVQNDMLDSELIRVTFETIHAWKEDLPPAALTTKRLSEKSLKLQQILNREIEPIELLFKRIPSIYEKPVEDTEQLITKLKESVDEMRGVSKVYFGHALSSMYHALKLGYNNGNRNLRNIAGDWANCFADDFVAEYSDGILKGFFSRVKTPYETDELLLNSISSLLIGKPIDRWDDMSITQFDRELKDVVRRIEEDALTSQDNVTAGDKSKAGIKHLIQGRMAGLFDRLISIVSEEEARSIVNLLINKRIGGGKQ